MNEKNRTVNSREGNRNAGNLGPIPTAYGENADPVSNRACSSKAPRQLALEPSYPAAQQLEISGTDEISLGYDHASSTYEEYWLKYGAGPTVEMFKRIGEKRGGRAIDCGSGTGFSTACLSRKVGPSGSILAVDLSEKMTEIAKRRLAELKITNVEFRIADVLEELKNLPRASFDIAIIAWVIGHVSCEEIFPLISRILKPGGEVGFVCHRHRSPLVPFEAFEEIALAQPQALNKLVVMTLPDGKDEAERHLKEAGFNPKHLQEGSFTVRYSSGEEVYESIMKAGLATSFYYSVRPDARKRMAELFIQAIDRRFSDLSELEIVHNYLFGVAVKEKA